MIIKVMLQLMHTTNAGLGLGPGILVLGLECPVLGLGLGPQVLCNLTIGCCITLLFKQIELHAMRKHCIRKPVPRDWIQSVGVPD